MLKSKIHRATVTDSNLNYVGSLTVDVDLLHAANILEGELVHVVNVTTGSRLETYTFAGGPGEICLNGAAARLAEPGDIVIVMAFAAMDEKEAATHKPTVIFVDGHNAVTTKSDSEHAASAS